MTTLTEKSSNTTATGERASNTRPEITRETLEQFLYHRGQVQVVEIQNNDVSGLKRKWNEEDDEYTRKLQSIWCHECCKHIQDECPLHRKLRPPLTYAVGSFPPEVRLCTSSIPEHTYGACAARRMPRGTWIGPYEGKRISANKISKDKDNTYVWEIYNNGLFSHFIDGSDETISSWMRFIRCARHKTEQNMSVIQYRQNIYYCATRDIEVGEEMLVWYHENYHQFWGVPLLLTQEYDGVKGSPIPKGIEKTPILTAAATVQPKMVAGNQTVVSESLYQQTLPTARSQSIKEVTGSLNDFHGATKTSESITSAVPRAYTTIDNHLFTTSTPTLPFKDTPQHSSQPQAPNSSKFSNSRPYLPDSPFPVINVHPLYPTISKAATTRPLPMVGYAPYPPAPVYSAPHVKSTKYSDSPTYPPSKGTLLHPSPSLAQYPKKSLRSSSYSERQIPPPLSPFPAQPIPGTFQRSPDVPMSSRNSPSTLVTPISPGVQRYPTFLRETPEISKIFHATTASSVSERRPPDQHLATSTSRHQREYNFDGAIAEPCFNSSNMVTSSEVRAEVKENMPVDETRNDITNGAQLKSSKHATSTPLQNLTPMLQNQSSNEPQDKQHDQVSSTVGADKEHQMSWKCGQCNEIFAQQLTLRMHVCTKAPQKPFHCGHCSLAFATPSELREHVFTHSNERSFKCGFCGRLFAGATTLGNHMRTHTGHRPYECEVCGQTFAIATQLSRHMKPPGTCGLALKEAHSLQKNVQITVEQ